VANQTRKANPALTNFGNASNLLVKDGASDRNRTCNLLIRSIARGVSGCLRMFHGVNTTYLFPMRYARSATQCATVKQSEKRRTM
jgi:hypothetical protein